MRQWDAHTGLAWSTQEDWRYEEEEDTVISLRRHDSIIALPTHQMRTRYAYYLHIKVGPYPFRYRLLCVPRRPPHVKSLTESAL
jgi:hypothetical protein